MTGNLQVITPAVVTLTPLGHGHLMPALNAQEGERAGWRYVKFFTASIRIPHTRRDYESLQKIHSAPGMKQPFAASCSTALRPDRTRSTRPGADCPGAEC